MCTEDPYDFLPTDRVTAVTHDNLLLGMIIQIITVF